MLTAHQISKSYQLNNILNEVSFNVNSGERVGLIGPNGCGKTTLLRILIGEETPEAGHANFTPSNLRIGYLSQGFTPPADLTISDLIKTATGDPEVFETRLAELAVDLAANPAQPALQTEYDTILDRLQQPSDIGRLSTILNALEIDTIPDDQLATTLSGGQKTRLALALVLLSDPQLLFLDEPTNHLDIGMLEWLEDWLSAFRGAALIVSHDRTFLDRTINRVLELDPTTQKIRSFEGSYTDYIEQKTVEHEKQLTAYTDQIAEIKRMKRDIARTRAQAERTEREASSIRIGGEEMKIKGYKNYQQGIAKKVAKKYKSREKKLDRFIDSDDRVERPKASWQIKLEFENPNRLGKDVLAIEELSVGYPGFDPLLVDLNLQVQSGQRIAFTGPNGSGKTTLLRAIAGRLKPIHGRSRLGASVKLGYMSQEQETLDPKLNAVETIQSSSAFNLTETRTFLHYFLFSGDDPLRPISLLSYGERSRLMVAKLVAEGCNFLILDEPINHLDIPSRERFEQALSGFEGTVLAVVHDRYFIQRFATEVWVLEDKTIRRKVIR
jgi:ATP-binding cassette, subfamily F, member 3